MKIDYNNCNCHPETCCHFDYYIYDGEGKRVIGDDNLRVLQNILQGLELLNQEEGK